jgi:hypothetical protein
MMVPKKFDVIKLWQFAENRFANIGSLESVTVICHKENPNGNPNYGKIRRIQGPVLHLWVHYLMVHSFKAGNC